MAYTLHIDEEGILQVNMTDEFREEDLEAYLADISAILDDVPEGGNIKTFINTLDLDRVNPNLRRSVGDYLENPKFGKTAVLGKSRVVKVMIDFVLKASGRSHMKYFTDQDKANEWLHS